MNIDMNNALATINEAVAKVNEQPQWKKDLMAARFGIVKKLLIYSFHALQLQPPEDEVIDVRASIIADKADVSNRQLKAAFMKAMDVKMEKDLRTPITYGDITKAARMVAEDTGKTIFGKWKQALPLLSDGELWDDSVKYFAKTYAQKEFAELVALDRRQLTNG